MEWFDACLNVAEEIIRADPLMGYVGLTSQTADKLGGFKVQGKDADAARGSADCGPARWKNRDVSALS